MTLNFQSQLQKKIEHEISKVTVLVQDSLEDLTEQLQPGNRKQILSLALDVMRPYLQSLGLRVSRLTFQDIEVILPAKMISQDSKEHLDEGAVISAALFALKKLWRKNSPRGHFQIEILGFEFERLRPIKAPIFLRCHLPTAQREAAYVELSEQKFSVHETTLQIYDQEDQVIAKLSIKSELKLEKVLTSTKSAST